MAMVMVIVIMTVMVMVMVMTMMMVMVLLFMVMHLHMVPAPVVGVARKDQRRSLEDGHVVVEVLTPDVLQELEESKESVGK
jgi:hypothetical protein